MNAQAVRIWRQVVDQPAYQDLFRPYRGAVDEPTAYFEAVANAILSPDDQQAKRAYQALLVMLCQLLLALRGDSPEHPSRQSSHTSAPDVNPVPLETWTGLYLDKATDPTWLASRMEKKQLKRRLASGNQSLVINRPGYDSAMGLLDKLIFSLNIHQSISNVFLNDIAEFCAIMLSSMKDRATDETAPTPQGDRSEQSVIQTRLQSIGRLRFLPPWISPGMPYVTPDDLADSDLTSYDPQYIKNLARHHQVESFRVGHQTALTMKGVEQLLTRERLSQSGRLSSRGRKPGSGWTPRANRETHPA